MASSNRHWPSMFRSNPACDVQQPQPDMNNGSPTSLLPSPAGGGKPSLISSGCEESTRSPEPKPRWNPRPEQIRILEGIFNSGMVNPPRDEIRRIRLQLQEYGQVGDANVFYWFQNRKSRTKNKLRAAGQLPAATGRAALARACVSVSPSTPAAASEPAPMTPPRPILAAPVAPTSSSSSSSDRSSGSSKSVKPSAMTSQSAAAAALQGMQPVTAIDLFSPALSACHLYYSHPMVPTPTAPVRALISPESLLQWPQSQYLPATELGGVLGSHAHTPAMHPAVSPGVLLGLCNEALGQEIIDMSFSKGLVGQYLNTTCSTEPISNKADAVSTVIREDEKARLGLLHYGFGAATAAPTPAPLTAPVHADAADDDATTAVLPSAAPISNVAASAVPAGQLQGLLDVGFTGGTAAPPTATVVAVARDAVMCASTTQYSVPAMMHLDVKLFGEAAVLLRHTGEPVLVDEAGVTVEPLQQGAVYYVLATN